MQELEVDGRPFTWVRDGVVKGRPLFLCAHGAGAPYTHPFMVGTAKGLAERGLCVVRFHFPYMEAAQREGRKRGPDGRARLLETWRVMLDKARKLRGHGPILIGGKSMGGRMASMLLAEGGAPDVVGAIYLGYPLHPPGKPEKLRADHLPAVPVPQLFVSGDKDRLCEPKLLRKVLEAVPTAKLVAVTGADHSLARSRKHPMRDADEWLGPVADFALATAALATTG